MASADEHAANSSMKEFIVPENWEERSYDVPALAVYSAHEYVPPDHEAYLRTVFPNLTYEEWPDTGHFLMMEEPERFNAAATRILLPFSAVEPTYRTRLKVVPGDVTLERGSDLVVTAGPILKVPHATIKAGWLEEGAFASAVDYDTYWDRAALKEASKFCTDDVPQLEYYRSIGYFQSIPPIYASLGELVTGQKPGRETATERTIGCNLGLALDDMATAPIIYRRAMERGIGTWLPL